VHQEAEMIVATAGSEVARLRSEIERIDRAIVNLIGERVRVASEIGGAKRTAGVPLVDPAREAAIVRRAGDLARQEGLPEEDVRDLFWRLVALSRRTQLETLSGAA